MFGIQQGKVVVPVDFSADSVDAVRAGLGLAGSQADLHVVHALAPLDYLSPGVLHEFADGRNREADARHRLEALLREAGTPEAQAELLVGDPGLEVADYAGRVGAGLIVVPSHGHHGVRRFLLGSTAERIMRHAHCSVLVLRRRDAR